MINVLLKANLQVSQNQRATAGAVFTTTCIIADKCEPAAEAIEAGTECNNKVSEIGSGHRLGPPHTFQAEAFVEKFVTLAEEKQTTATGAKDQSYMKEVVIAAKIMKQMETTEIGEAFTYFRCIRRR